MHQDVVRPERTAPLNHPCGTLERVCERHFRRIAAVILLLAALNLGVRLNHEIVTDWTAEKRLGVIYYLRENRVRGVLLWNIWGAVNAARELIAEPGPFKLEDLKKRIPLG